MRIAVRGVTKGDTIALVAIVPKKKDWDILRNEHWYRIPVRSAPLITPAVKFLAFYQPKIFDAEKYAVNYYARVSAVEIQKRIELLPAEPKHSRAQEDYYRLTVGELMPLPRPIPSKRWRRITFIPTTLEKLLTADEINDLYTTSPIEEKLYYFLKREKISAERQFFVYDAAEPHCLDFAFFCRDGKLNVECDGAYHTQEIVRTRDRKRDNELVSAGWSILRFTGREINNNPATCLRLIKKTLKILQKIDKTKKLEQRETNYRHGAKFNEI